jgi:transposase, IS30 family
MGGSRGGSSRGREVAPSQRREIAGRLREGARVKDLAAQFDCSTVTVWRIGAQAQLLRRRVDHSRLRLGFEERERISRGIAAGESARTIARALGRAPSTVSREIERAGGRCGYRALRAERGAVGRLARPKPGKLSRSPRLRAAVEAGLERRWSPQQISARLKLEHPEDPEMRISHETIYQSLYVQSRGELRSQLTASLRRGRKRRRARGAAEHRGRMADMVLIAERPPEVDERAVPGHWEGDLLVGKAGRSFIATLVERQSRYVLLARLGSERKSAHVVATLAATIARLPAHLALSLTWDQGNELAEHTRFSAKTGVAVYFCDPHSPWQRGSNENTNGLLRQYLPKGSDLAARSQVELDEIAAELNGRPRQTLGWATPAEKMQELLR